jgi:hypothetical protein
MKTSHRLAGWLILPALLSTLNSQLSTASAQGTAFTYQGQLDAAGTPANGSYDLTFTLFSAGSGGSAVAGPLTNSATAVSNGLFTVTLDFGSGVFDGTARWLEIAVRTNGASGFVTLAPRQPLTPAPYAILAGSATTAAGVPASGVGTGTANISITGNAGTATSAAYAGSAAMAYTAVTATTATTATNLIGNVADSQLSANIPRLNGTNSFTGTNTFPGVTVATNVNNVIAGAFIGNGSGLTNLNTAQFANSVLTNGETGITLGGTFSGNATTATTANNFSGSLSGDVTGTQSATVVSTVGGQSAANIASGASVANAATSAATANTIVKRDASGSFTNTSITLNGNLNLPATTAGAGIIYSGGNPFIHAYGINNFFAGGSAGNLTMSGDQNTGIGELALHNNTSGYFNTANGAYALYNNTNGFSNTADGYNALYANTNGGYNTAIGGQALFYNTTGSDNTALGFDALAINTSGNNNIALGYLAGANLATGSSNIDIGNQGVAGDTNIIRIGSGQTSAFIAGVINGNGAGLTNLNASQLTGGTISLAQLPGAVLTNGQTGNVTLNGGLFLPATTTAPDAIYSGIATLLFADNNQNFFAGVGAGNSGVSGGYNVGVGHSALTFNTTGSYNAASGSLALQQNMTGSDNTANGYMALQQNTMGGDNTASGFNALKVNVTGNYNTASGSGALQSATGNNNIALGYQAGSGIGAGSNDIYIGNTGVAGDNGIIRIGTPGTHNTTYLAGMIQVSSNLFMNNNDIQLRNDLNHGVGWYGTGKPFSGVNVDGPVLYGYSGGGLGYHNNNYGTNLVLYWNNSGYVGIGNTSPGYLLVVGTGGAYCNGTTWVNGSDRNAKEAFTAINPRTVLEKVTALPITEWKYKAEADGSKHLGPVAQDFHAAFGLNGTDDKHIATVDESGVALAAIQGLNQKVESENAALRAENAGLKARLEKLENLMSARNGGGQ